ncbi:MAG: DUF1161 domain-containing protein [Pseudomonadota bacterium]|jgi:hypothetical protein|nr:MAG: hypothetical protein DIU62_13275 [Pseudomonadota bacterium]
MKRITGTLAMLLVAGGAFAQAKDCDELKAEIEQKIRNNGVAVFTLEVVDKDAPGDGKVVGTCGGGTRKIIYRRGEAPAPAPAPAPGNGG